MPELPEVECIAVTLRAALSGQRIRRVRCLSPLAADGHPEALARAVEGRRIRTVRRRGKFILLELDPGLVTIHLRMTGRLTWNGAVGAHTRAVVEMDGGRLVLDDVRQFARLSYEEAAPPAVARLGPEPFELTSEQFRARLRGRRGAVKPLLLNQRFLAGLGNIYVDEALYRAGIHPLARAGQLGAGRAGRLQKAIVEVLAEAIEAGGSSISDYADGLGRKGSFQLRHQVYGKAGAPCPRCGAEIRRIVVGQRGTHYCPRCQPR